MRSIHLVLALALGTLAACGRRQEGVETPKADSAGAMAGMQSAMRGMQMMPLMRAHLDSLGAMQPAQIAAAMAAHQDLASRMMDAMGADMLAMRMKPDSAWGALGDSLRQDLAELPVLSGAALQTRMKAHIGRMQRMLAMHEGMMKMMKM